MTTLLATASAPMQPVPWRRLAWVSARRYRSTLVGVGIALGLLAAYLAIRGHAMRSAYDAAERCAPQSSAACRFAWNSFSDTYGSLGFIGAVLVFVPALVGAFAGAPLLARELETGTFRFAWTQGAGRTRWLVAHLVPGVLGVAAVTAAFGLLTAWYVQPLIGSGYLQRLQPTIFPVTGISIVGWGVFAYALGVLAGVLARRVLPAMAATLVVWTGMAILTTTLRRYHYEAPLATSNPTVNPGDQPLALWWTLGGHRVSDAQLNDVLRAVGAETGNGGGDIAVKPGGDPNDPFHYLLQHGYTQWLSYQPNSRYWPFQWIELTWLALVALLLLATAVWLVRRRA
jgi:hypothetical protein